MRSPSRLFATLAAAVALAGCSRQPSPQASASPAPTPVRVTDVDVGRSVTPDKTIAEETTTFRPTDNFYAVVKTEGSTPATVAAQWTYGGNQTVSEFTE